MLGCAVTFAACSTGAQPASDGPYSAMFEQARGLATSQFELDVLEDDVVTRAEYEEAMQRYVTCIEDNGAHVTLRDQTGYYVYEVGGNIGLYDSVSGECSQGTSALIEGLYVETLTNPDNIDPDELTAQCFVAMGLVDEPFTRNDFENLLTAAGAVSSTAAPDVDPVIDPRAQEILASEDARNCMANPNYHRTDGAG